MKGEAYKAYYIANRERILATNKARSAERRAKLREEAQTDESVREMLRASGRNVYLATKANKNIRAYKAFLEQCSPDHPLQNPPDTVLKAVSRLTKKGFEKYMEALSGA